MSTGGQTGTALGTTHTNLTADIIETRVRAITKRDNTTVDTATEIDDYTAEACREISKRKLCLKSSSSGTLAADSEEITAPTDMVASEAAIDELYLDSKPMDRLTYNEYLHGKKTGFAYRDGTIYVKPSSTNSRSYTLTYSRYHSSTVATIEFNDDYKMAIVYRVCQLISEKYEREDKIIQYLQQYEAELNKQTKPQPVMVKMRQFRE